MNEDLQNKLNNESHIGKSIDLALKQIYRCKDNFFDNRIDEMNADFLGLIHTLQELIFELYKTNENCKLANTENAQKQIDMYNFLNDELLAVLKQILTAKENKNYSYLNDLLDQCLTENLNLWKKDYLSLTA